MLSYISSFFTSGDKPTASVSVPCTVPAKAMWELLKDFGNWSQWFPLYASEQVIGQVKEGVGMIRRNTTITGMTYEDILKEVDDSKMFLAYNYISMEPKIPVLSDYRATIQVEEINETHSKVTWNSWTTLVAGTDSAKLTPMVEQQSKFYTKAIHAAVLSITLKTLYTSSFGIINDRLRDVTKALLMGQNPVWQYDSYPVQPLPKMVRGLPASEVLPAHKIGQLIGRLLESIYAQVDHAVLHSDDKMPAGVSKYIASAVQIANAYGDPITKEITEHLAQHWADDAEFCQQYLQGANPLQIHAVTDLDVIPEAMRHLKAQGKTLSELIKEKRLFVADYATLDGLKQHANLYFYAPTVLMFREILDNKESRLNIVGIRLERTPNAPIYTPCMKQKNRFLLAKMFVACADNQLHQFAYHLGISHLGMEPIIVAVHNQLPAEHPIHVLLKPHLQETIGINFLARQTLIPTRGAFTEHTFAVGSKQGVLLASRTWANYDFYGFSFPEQLKARGFDREGTDGLTNYLYRDDGYKMWDVLGKYLTEYVESVYADDKAVAEDQAIQNWAKEMTDPEKAKTPGFKEEILTRKDLALILLIIVWNGSALHSFLSFSQWPYVGNIPNRPNAMYAPMPEDKGEDVTEEYLAQALAPPLGTAFQLSFTWALSLSSNSTLMDLGNDIKKKSEIGKRFHESLVALTDDLNARNAKLSKEGKAPYKFLLPENVACSVDI